MARRKNTDTVDTIETQETPVIQENEQPEVEVTKDENENEDSDNEQPQEDGASSDETSTSPTNDESKVSVEIPEHVQKILASYPNYSCLYIDEKGGAYPEHAQPNWTSDAILYQNPYYKGSSKN